MDFFILKLVIQIRSIEENNLCFEKHKVFSTKKENNGNYNNDNKSSSNKTNDQSSAIMSSRYTFYCMSEEI